MAPVATQAVNATPHQDASWTLAAPSASVSASDQPNVAELKKLLEKGNEQQKITTMKTILAMMLAGDPLPDMIMHVIRFVLPHKSKALKKLQLFYWELCPKKTADGKLRQEMILVCNYIRSDLQSHNEFVRGCTLRLLCKLLEPELLEPLVPSCRTCLTHRTPYVRKNAIFAIMTIYKHFEFLIPDAPEIIYEHLQSEKDDECKRNAFLMLCNTDSKRALQYLASVSQQIASLDELMQLAIIELIRKDYSTNAAAKALTVKDNYVRCIVSLFMAPSRAVKYEAASVLPSLTTAPMAIKEVAACYIELASKEPDNNIKLIVLEQINALREVNGKVLNDLAMDVLRIVASPDIAVCRRAIQITLEMLTMGNVTEIVGFLKKEITKTYDPAGEKSANYRQLLINAVHQCAIKFPEVAPDVVHVLMEFLTDATNTSAIDVISFVREAVELNAALRPEIISKLLQNFCEIKTGKVMRGALWVLGEYCTTIDTITETFKQIRAGLGELPIVASEQRLLDEANAGSAEPEKKEGSAPVSPVRSAPKRVLADGTYATESAFVTTGTPTSAGTKTEKERPPVRNLIMNGDYFLGAVLATALTKLVLRAGKLAQDASQKNSLRAEAMLIMTSIIRVGQSAHVTIPIDEDSYDRILMCLRVLANGDASTLADVFTTHCHQVYSRLVHSQEKKAAELKNSKAKKNAKVGVDDVLVFKQFKNKTGSGDLVDAYDADVMKATGANDYKNETSNRLNRIVQLSGFSDPVYAEAYVDVHQYDILLDILIVNQTSETLQNLTVEFATLGDLKLVERPAACSMGPHSFHSIKANIKVSSTETGIIFGNIVYDGSSPSGDSHVIVLNDIHIDIMDYIHPATCDENEFRSMWTEFEWENKINFNTNITELREFLAHIMKSTNMTCLTPEQALSGDCGFLSANMYAKSIFGEDALANISLEKGATPTSPVIGHIRIRSKTQGIALSLGDKITLAQKVKV